jgi:hypothetical protein
MQNLAKALVIALLLCAGVSANTADPCVDIKSELDCQNYESGKCTWNQSLKQCQPSYITEHYCYSFSIFWHCVKNGCHWDDHTNLCYPS